MQITNLNQPLANSTMIIKFHEDVVTKDGFFDNILTGKPIIDDTKSVHHTDPLGIYTKIYYNGEIRMYPTRLVKEIRFILSEEK